MACNVRFLDTGRAIWTPNIDCLQWGIHIALVSWTLLHSIVQHFLLLSGEDIISIAEGILSHVCESYKRQHVYNIPAPFVYWPVVLSWVCTCYIVCCCIDIVPDLLSRAECYLSFFFFFFSRVFFILTVILSVCLSCEYRRTFIRDLCVYVSFDSDWPSGRSSHAVNVGFAVDEQKKKWNVDLNHLPEKTMRSMHTQQIQIILVISIWSSYSNKKRYGTVISPYADAILSHTHYDGELK